MRHADEYFARLWYEENRWRWKHRIWFIYPMPVAFVWKDGVVDYLTVSENLVTIQRQKYIGKPRWCEWGVDISDVKIENTTFYKKEVYLFNKQTLMSYTFPVYVQSLSDDTCIQKVKEIARRMMLRF